MAIHAITNQKGGVGKTTTCVNLAASLAELGERVLMIDFDPQGNATTGVGIELGDVSVAEWLLGGAATDACCVRAAAGFDVLPADGRLTSAEVRLMTFDEREFQLRRRLTGVSGYDHVLIDCPPSLSLLTVNALVAADGALIPMQCEYYALEGLSALMDTITRIQQGPNPSLEITGLIRTMYDIRNRLTNDVSEQLLDHFGERVFRTLIPRNVRLAEAPSFGQPVLQYDAQSRGAKAYLALAGEMLRRHATGPRSNRAHGDSW